MSTENHETLVSVDDPMKAAPGWYPDPSGPYGQLRYFDGYQWTENRAAAPLAAAPYGAQPPPAKTTPDGRPLAGWGIRLAAHLIDGLALGVISVPITLAILIPVLNDQVDRMQQWQDTHPGQVQSFDPFWLYRDHWQALVSLALFGFALQAIYFMGFWRWKQASPGKLAVGLRIELRETAGPLPWGTIMRRWLLQYGVAVVYGVGGLFILLDGLWPLWDDKRQAIHDKWAATNVIDRRR